MKTLLLPLIVIKGNIKIKLRLPYDQVKLRPAPAIIPLIKLMAVTTSYVSSVSCVLLNQSIALVKKGGGSDRLIRSFISMEEDNNKI